MADANLTITGNLTADPELRVTNSGVSVAQFSVASTPRVKVNGEWQDGETVFLRVSVWRDLAEGAADELRKGDSVIVVGKLKQRSYEKDGQKRSVYEIDGESVGKSVRAKKNRDGGGYSQQPARDSSAW